MLIKNRAKAKQIHIQQDVLGGTQLNIVDFESPLQQVLQQQILLLRLLNQQNKWQLWLSTRPMLKRSWLENSGLNTQKVVQLANANTDNIIDTIEKALLSQTCSYVVACISDLTLQDKQRLQIAVKSSGTHLFLVNDDFMNYKDFMTMSKQVTRLH